MKMIPGFICNLIGLLSTDFKVLHSAVSETPINKSSSLFFRKHLYFSSLRDSLVLATAKKWLLSTNQSPKHVYSTTMPTIETLIFKNYSLIFWVKLKNRNVPPSFVPVIPGHDLYVILNFWFVIKNWAPADWQDIIRASGWLHSPVNLKRF